MIHAGVVNLPQLMAYEDENLYPFSSEEADARGQHRLLVEAVKDIPYLDHANLNINPLLAAYRKSQNPSYLWLVAKFGEQICTVL